jgi:hypothetical protein
MKFNLKVIIAAVVLVGAVFWGFDSVRTRSYSGTDLNVGVGSGPVTLTNPSDEALPVQLVGTGTRSFSVSSTAEDVSGSSSRQGSGSNTIQLFEFELPAGVTELMIVTRGSDVKFVADAGSRLDVIVQPLTAGDEQTTLIIAVIVILGALFYISRATGHPWLSLIRREKAASQDTQPHVAGSTGDA